MADPRESEGGSEVGYFYYDWALSRYRWTNKHSASKGDAVPSKKVIPEVRVVKEFAKDDSELCVPKENERKRNDFAGEMKKPLQDRDINLQISLSRHHSEDNIIAQVLSNQVSVLKKDCSNASHSLSREAQEVCKGHGTMIKVLQTRLLRLRAAQTLWHKDTNALIEYLLRLKDDAVLVDVMPFLTSRVREVSPEGQALSMGACLEMLPALERLLTSKFEDYIISGLNMTREMIKRWWLQLKAASNKGVDPELYRCSRSVSGLYMAVVSLSSIIVRLTKWKGPVGEKALVVTRLLDLL